MVLKATTRGNRPRWIEMEASAHAQNVKMSENCTKVCFCVNWVADNDFIFNFQVVQSLPIQWVWITCEGLGFGEGTFPSPIHFWLRPLPGRALEGRSSKILIFRCETWGAGVIHHAESKNNAYFWLRPICQSGELPLYPKHHSLLNSAPLRDTPPK